jgi:hypothetical protein
MVKGFYPLHLIKNCGFFMLSESRSESVYVIYLLLIFKVFNLKTG